MSREQRAAIGEAIVRLERQFYGRGPSSVRVSVTEETSLQDAIELISFHRINCLPVVDADRYVRGVLTTTDLLTTLYRVLNWLEAAN